MLRLLVALIFAAIALPAAGQTTCPNVSPPGTVFNVTQPFHFFFDQLNTAIPGVDHYAITVTPTNPAGPAVTTNVGIPSSTASVNPGCTTYSVLANSALAVGNYTYAAVACTPTTCLAPTGSVVFVINTPPPPAATNPGNLNVK